MKELELRYSDEYQHAVYFEGKKIGKFILDEAGYYGYWPEPKLTGYWSSYAIRMIADKLDELNKEWDQQVVESLVELAKVDELKKLD